MLKTGQLQEMWVVASQTHLQFNMVRLVAKCAEVQHLLPGSIDLSVHSNILTRCRLCLWGAVFYLLSWLLHTC